MHGILLAGGSGTRLRPTTLAVNKHLLHVFDKPMIFYPLTTLILIGVRKVTIVCNRDDESLFKRLLGDGADFGLQLDFAIQDEAGGIGAAISIAAKQSNADSYAVILGDNIFHGRGLGRHLSSSWKGRGAAAFGFKVADPRQYGVAVFDTSGRVTRFIEKPLELESDIAVTGLYFFDSSVASRLDRIKPSSRGELEVTSLLNSYLKDDDLITTILPRGTAWIDAGTNESLIESANYIRIVQERTAQDIGNPYEAAIAVRLGK